MTNRFYLKSSCLLGGVLCMALSGCATQSAEGQSAAKEAENKLAVKDTVLESPVIEGMVLIPAGEFTMGSNKSEDASKWREANALNPYGFRDNLYVDERPLQKVTLPTFLIDQYEVTNASYRDFVIATNRGVP